MIKKTYQNFFDIQTKPGYMTMKAIFHGGREVYERTAPFWAAYKYYKLGRVTLKMVPASTLPVDPTGLSYEAGETTVDPRDMLTPGLVRITNGEDIDTGAITSTSGNEAHAIYQNMLLSTHWFKFNLQRGITKSASPRYWVVGQFRQDYYPGSMVNMPGYRWNPDDSDYKFQTTDAVQLGSTPESDTIIAQTTRSASSARGFFQTGEHGKLGWLPTDSIINIGIPGQEGYVAEPALNNIPVIELFRIILPPAYKTTFFYRCFVTYTIYFRTQIDVPPAWTFPTAQGGTETITKGYLDRFVYTRGIEAAFPGNYTPPALVSKPTKQNDGSSDQA